MKGKLILIGLFSILVALTYNNYLNEQEEKRLKNCYLGWLRENELEGKYMWPVHYEQWKAMYGEKYKYGKP